MDERFDAISVGDLNVEFFHKTIDGSFIAPADLTGPYPSGAAAIFIDTMARLGAKTAFVGTVGKDEFGRCIIDRLMRDQVNTDYVYELEDATTGTAFRTCYSDGSRRFIFHIGNAAPARLSAEHVNASYIENSRWLHVSGNVLAFGNTTREAVLKAVDLAFNSNIPISLDPNLRLEMMKKDEIYDLLGPVLEKTTLLLPSKGEIKYITGIDNEDDGAEKLIEQGIKIIVRKEGAGGSSIFTRDSKLHVGPYAVEEIDATGCGDAFGGAFVYGILQGWDMKACGRFANAVGAITATKYGPMEGIESLSEVESFIEMHDRK